MSAPSAAARRASVSLTAEGLARFQRIVLWLLVFSGFFVKVEPAPYELVFLVTAAVFVATGLSAHVALLPLIVLLLVYNLGGLASLVPHVTDGKAVIFTATTVYLALTAIFFAMCVLRDTEARLRVIRSGYCVAALAASITAILGVFDIAGLYGTFTFSGRAIGTFQDPNVFAAFIVPAAVFLSQDLLLGRRFALLRAPALIVILFASLVAFSRGAWVNMAGSLALLTVLTFLTAASPVLRLRIVIVCMLGALLTAAGIAAAVSLDAVTPLFTERASLTQSYDVGETGRFGTQLRSIPTLLTHMNGLGPLQFGKIFGQDPHNVYLNAFASYGWIGGFSYLALILLSLYAGFRCVLTRSPCQHHAIAVFACFIMLCVQGLQIDTDHWRHAYLLLGLLWGLYAVINPHAEHRRPVAAG